MADACPSHPATRPFLCLAEVATAPGFLRIEAGRDPSTLTFKGLVIDGILEIAPTTPEPSIVWQWFTYDHLVQDFDSSKANYGDPAEHPELVDLNYFTLHSDDWTHFNSIGYNAELDQIVVNPLCLSEFWVIDHSTTTDEAAGHTGGDCGRGGDLLYRWGNPESYRAGTPADRLLSGQHDVDWIAPGLPGAGDLLVFNNMAGLYEGAQYSSVLQVTSPLNPDGTYFMTGAVFGPVAPTWQFIADPPNSFFGMNMSSAQRLIDGNTLICNGPNGKVIEVLSSGEIVWVYDNAMPVQGAQVFNAIRYPVDYPGLVNLPQ